MHGSPPKGVRACVRVCVWREEGKEKKAGLSQLSMCEGECLLSEVFCPACCVCACVCVEGGEEGETEKKAELSWCEGVCVLVCL